MPIKALNSKLALGSYEERTADPCSTARRYDYPTEVLARRETDSRAVRQYIHPRSICQFFFSAAIYVHYEYTYVVPAAVT